MHLGQNAAYRTCVAENGIHRLDRMIHAVGDFLIFFKVVFEQQIDICVFANHPQIAADAVIKGSQLKIQFFRVVFRREQRFIHSVAVIGVRLIERGVGGKHQRIVFGNPLVAQLPEHSHHGNGITVRRDDLRKRAVEKLALHPACFFKTAFDQPRFSAQRSRLRIIGIVALLDDVDPVLQQDFDLRQKRSQTDIDFILKHLVQLHQRVHINLPVRRHQNRKEIPRNNFKYFHTAHRHNQWFSMNYCSSSRRLLQYFCGFCSDNSLLRSNNHSPEYFAPGCRFNLRLRRFSFLLKGQHLLKRV